MNVGNAAAVLCWAVLLPPASQAPCGCRFRNDLSLPRLFKHRSSDHPRHGCHCRRCSVAAQVLAASMNGSDIYISRDSGATWAKQRSPNYANYTTTPGVARPKIKVSPDGNTIIVG